MIEVIYKEEKKKAEGNETFFTVPKNIRQIGEPGGEHRIYLEDYVSTFLKRLAEDGEKEGKTAILLGGSNWQEGISYLFIRGALLVENLDAAPEKVAFTEEIWNWIEEKQKQYFPEQETVGWFYTRPDLPIRISDSFYRTHLHYFGGNDKVFFLKDPTEQEEAFFVYENGQMVRQPGYYVYYEKNPEMQEYMVAVQGSSTVDDSKAAEDQAVVRFRKRISSKKENGESRERKQPVLMYAASACLTLTVLAAGVNLLNTYQKMRDTTGQVAEEVREVVEIPSETPAESRQSMEKEPEPAETPVTEAVRKENQAESAAGSFGQDTEKQEENREEENREEENWKEESREEDLREAEEPVADEPEETQPEEQKEETAEEPEKPAETSAEAETGASVYETYTVQFGDSLYKISTGRYGTMDRIPEICRINGISPDDLIYPGQKILLP